MKIGIIVYSKTGNTLSVADRLKEKLLQNHQDATLEQITVSGNPEQGMNHFTLEHIPNPNNYDFLILGAPVNAFALCPAMIFYLNQFVTLSNKKVVCFVTEQFPSPWLGGKQAINKFQKLVTEKQGTVVATGIVNWGSKKKEQQIEDFINKIVTIVNSK